MLSRVAENVYWLSRYLERMENTACLVSVHGRMLMDLPGVQPQDGWRPLISISGLDELYFEYFPTTTELGVTRFLMTDERNPGSVVNVANAIRNNLRSARDVLPKQLYEKISALVRYVENNAAQGCHYGTRGPFLDSIASQVLEISGAVHGSLRHDQAYRFMRMACYLERADMTSRVLDVPSSIGASDDSAGGILPFENRDWAAVLKSRSAMQMYRRHVRQPISAEGCLTFLLNDDQLPSACKFCLVRLDRCLEHFNNNDEARSSVANIVEHLDNADISELAADAALRHQFLDELQMGLIKTSSAIADAYFPPIPEST